MLKSKKSNFVQFISTGLVVEARILKEQLVPHLREGKLLLHTGQSKPPCNAEPQTSKQTKNNRSSSSHEQRHKRIVIVKSKLNWILNVNVGLCGGDIQPALTGSSLLGTLGWARHLHTCILAYLHICMHVHMQCILAHLRLHTLIFKLYTFTLALSYFHITLLHTCIFLHLHKYAAWCILSQVYICNLENIQNFLYLLQFDPLSLHPPSCPLADCLM